MSTGLSTSATPQHAERAAALRIYLAEQLAKDLPAFTKKSFHVLHPGRKLVWSAHYRPALRVSPTCQGASAAEAYHQRPAENIEVDPGHDHFPRVDLAH
jgi:hypothetical protein